MDDYSFIALSTMNFIKQLSEDKIDLKKARYFRTRIHHYCAMKIKVICRWPDICRLENYQYRKRNVVGYHFWKSIIKNLIKTKYNLIITIFVKKNYEILQIN